MKIVNLVAAVALLSSTAFAGEKINAVNPASPDGGTRQVLTAVTVGFDSKLTHAGTPVNAVNFYSEPNTLTVWSSEWTGNPKIISPKITESNTVGLILYETVMCSREFSNLQDMKGKTVKIATWGHIHAKRFLDKLGSQHNINFVVVPYSGSGSISMGYAGSDANTVFVLASRQKAVLADGKTTCFLSSSKNQIDFRYVDAIITINASKKLTDELRQSLAKQSAGATWQEKLAGTRTFIGGTDLAYFDESTKALSEIIK